MFFDDGQRTDRTHRTGVLGSLSGPYLLVSTTKASYVGAPLASLKKLSGTVVDNFGTRLLSTSADGTALVVTDLADADYRSEVPLPDDLAANTVLVSAQLWGDRVGATFLSQ